QATQPSNVMLRLGFLTASPHRFEMSALDPQVLVEYGSSSEMAIERVIVTFCELQTSTQSSSPMSRKLKCLVFVSRTPSQPAMTVPHSPESRRTTPSMLKFFALIGTTR